MRVVAGMPSAGHVSIRVRERVWRTLRNRCVPRKGLCLERFAVDGGSRRTGVRWRPSLVALSEIVAGGGPVTLAR